jgi:hypothetical protein
MAVTQNKSKTTAKKQQKTAKKPTKKVQSAPKVYAQATQKPTRKPGTYKPFEPSADQRNLVILGSAQGMPEEMIADLIINPATNKAISRNTLRQHFAHELDHGREIVLMKIGGTMVSIATDRNHKGCVTAGIWLQKTWGRMREAEPEWSERKRLADENAEGGANAPEVEYDIELILEEPKALPPPAGTTVQ